MAGATERRVALPATERSPGLARTVVREAVQAAYGDAVPDLLLDEALLLTTELVTNAVVHAGTELVIRVAADTDELSITVTDASPGVLDPMPASAPSSLGEGGRGLYLVASLADAWGTTHDRTGKGVWFRLRVSADRRAMSPDRPGALDRPPGADVTAGAMVAPAPRAPLSTRDLGWVTTIPEQLRRHLSPLELLGELLHRLLESLGAAGGAVWTDLADGTGPQELATAGLGATLPRPWPHAVEWQRATDGPDRLVVPLSLVPPARGALVLAAAPHAAEPSTGLAVDEPEARAFAVLAAERMALVVQQDIAQAGDERQRGALSFLAEASQLLAGSLASDLTLTLLSQLSVPRLGGWCAVHAVDGRDEPVLAAVSHADERALPALRAVLSGRADGDGDAAGDAESRLVAERLLDRVRQALRGRVTVPLGRPGDGVVVPLVARRQVLGAMTLGRSEDRPLGTDEAAVAEDLARRAALALDNARLYEERTAIAQALQQTLLPAELPSGPGLDLGARYVAAGEGTIVGGDFYDVVGLGPGRWLFAVGDVCGKGAEAASVTGLVRDVIRLLSREGRPIEDVLRALNAAVLDQGDRARFCTVAVALVEEVGDGLDVTLCLAGHLRPVALGGDGTAVLVGDTGTVVGILDDLDLHLTRLRLQPGESLVFYTDGVTERRNGRRMFGEDNLLQTLRGASGLAADQVAARLQGAASDFARDPLRDDLAVLVVRRPPSSSAPPEQRSADTVGASA